MYSVVLNLINILTLQNTPQQQQQQHQQNSSESHSGSNLKPTGCVD